jgi:hypothetical protein
VTEDGKLTAWVEPYSPGEVLIASNREAQTEVHR